MGSSTVSFPGFIPNSTPQKKSPAVLTTRHTEFTPRGSEPIVDFVVQNLNLRFEECGFPRSTQKKCGPHFHPELHLLGLKRTLAAGCACGNFLLYYRREGRPKSLRESLCLCVCLSVSLCVSLSLSPVSYKHLNLPTTSRVYI